MDVNKVIVQGIADVKLPKMAKIKQSFQNEEIESLSEVIEREIYSTDFPQRIKKGDEVAIGVGSRGIDKIDLVAKEIVKIVKQLGGEPFIVPAMGSHGGATAQGQQEVLAGYGVTQEKVGAPIVSSMEVVKLGETEDGKPVYFDKSAYEADAVIAVNRVKVHTDFSGEIESGIMKMLVIGFGKHKGASKIHSYGFDVFHKLIPEAGRLIIEKAPIALGIGLLENAYDHLYKIKAATPSEIENTDRKLLKEQKRILPGIPFKEVDVLVIDEMGKNISGSGIDTNVIGRVKSVYSDIKYIVVRDLSEDTHGNATGIGLADIIPQKLFEKIDFGASYTNMITARVIQSAKLPIVLENEELAIKTAIVLSNKSYEDLKLVHIKNTLQLGEMNISKTLISEAKTLKAIEIMDEEICYSFDSKGELNLGK